ARQRKNDLFEGLLDEIVVIMASVPDDPVKGTVHDFVQPIVDFRSYAVVGSLDGLDQRLVAQNGGFAAGRSTPGHHPKARSRRCSSPGGHAFSQGMVPEEHATN